MITALLLSAFVLMKPDVKGEFLQKRAALVVRQIGHQLLLHAGDSTSRVLPVKKISDGTFQLEFQSDFSFKPDTLVKIVQQKLALANLPLNYMVHVVECSTQAIVYGFEISPTKNDIVPCLGRTQPRGCYTILVAFLSLTDQDNSYMTYFLSFVALLGITAFAFISRALKKTNESASPSNSQTITIGKYQFDSGRKNLISETEKIELSDKETSLLAILAAHPNQLIERDRLLKEVWEDQGVFTGRSLDMFVSKLRKKLSKDASLRITNVHGRGYKLEV